ncbi:hypothetical protein K440DRAFT_639250 [Wilcoxina mikolae CBS 423.85]|nr:hypothetical protein K440DRAFT_639250 [Wilcoxina mikolae CBS 423.85]
MSSPSPAPEPHPIYNTTYTLYALPPLFSFPALTSSALKPHAKRLLQLFRGENLRGIALPPPSTEQAQLSRAGRLLSCTWTPLPSFADEDDPIGIRIDVKYENASYTTLLMSDGRGAAKEGFTRLPLLLSRLPSSLRSQLLDYLATNFDILPLPLELPETLLRQCLDEYITASRGGGGKDVVLTFAGKGEGLKRVTITVASEDVEKFWRRGEGGGEDGAGFLRTLGGHLESAMGLRIEEVVLVKATTGGFVLAVEGKGKFFEGGGSAVVEKVLQEADPIHRS